MKRISKQVKAIADAHIEAKTTYKIMELNKRKPVSYEEAIGKSVVWASYAHNFSGEEIKEIGYNYSNGVSYIELENGIFICSNSGRDAFYQIVDENEWLGMRVITDLNNFLLNEF